MNLYNYDENTKEYLYTSVAEADPEETKIQGKFIPLIPANCTEIPIPTYNSDNQIPIFENDNWVTKPDYRKNYYKVNNNLNVEDIITIGEQEGYYIVDKATGEDIKQNSDWYKISSNNIVKKSSSEYEAEQAQKERERLNLLSMTRGDVFEALILAKGLGKGQIRAMIEQAELDTVTKALYLNRFDEALEFYRGYPIFDMLGQALGITSEMLDKFFDTRDYHYLTTCKLTINAMPTEATVTGAGSYPYGTLVDYKVELEGYKPYIGSIELLKDNELNIVLEKIEKVVDENTTDYNESDIQNELDTTVSKSDEINTDILE